jgi:hypothetical protein
MNNLILLNKINKVTIFLNKINILTNNNINLIIEKDNIDLKTD